MALEIYDTTNIHYTLLSLDRDNEDALRDEVSYASHPIGGGGNYANGSLFYSKNCTFDLKRAFQVKFEAQWVSGSADWTNIFAFGPHYRLDSSDDSSFGINGKGDCNRASGSNAVDNYWHTYMISYDPSLLNENTGGWVCFSKDGVRTREMTWSSACGNHSATGLITGFYFAGMGGANAGTINIRNFSIVGSRSGSKKSELLWWCPCQKDLKNYGTTGGYLQAYSGGTITKGSKNYSIVDCPDYTAGFPGTKCMYLHESQKIEIGHIWGLESKHWSIDFWAKATTITSTASNKDNAFFVLSLGQYQRILLGTTSEKTHRFRLYMVTADGTSGRMYTTTEAYWDQFNHHQLTYYRDTHTLSWYVNGNLISSTTKFQLPVHSTTTRTRPWVLSIGMDNNGIASTATKAQTSELYKANYRSYPIWIANFRMLIGASRINEDGHSRNSTASNAARIYWQSTLSDINSNSCLTKTPTIYHYNVRNDGEIWLFRAWGVENAHVGIFRSYKGSGIDSADSYSMYDYEAHDGSSSNRGNLVPNIPGKFNKYCIALYKDSSTSSVEYNYYTASMGEGTKRSEWTCSFWLKLSNIDQIPSTIAGAWRLGPSFVCDGINSSGLDLCIYKKSNTLVLIIINESTNKIVWTGETDVTNIIEDWTHIALWARRRSLQVYINGQHDGTWDISGIVYLQSIRILMQISNTATDSITGMIMIDDFICIGTQLFYPSGYTKSIEVPTHPFNDDRVLRSRQLTNITDTIDIDNHPRSEKATKTAMDPYLVTCMGIDSNSMKAKDVVKENVWTNLPSTFTLSNRTANASKFNSYCIDLGQGPITLTTTGDKALLWGEDWTISFWNYRSKTGGTSENTLLSFDDPLGAFRLKNNSYLYRDMLSLSYRHKNPDFAEESNSIQEITVTTGSLDLDLDYKYKQGPVPTGEWTHIALVNYQSILKVYKNGVCVIRFPMPTHFNPIECNTITFGKDTFSDTNASDSIGLIDDITIVKQCALWKSNFTPPTEALCLIDGTGSSVTFNISGLYIL